MSGFQGKQMEHINYICPLKFSFKMIVICEQPMGAKSGLSSFGNEENDNTARLVVIS